MSDSNSKRFLWLWWALGIAVIVAAAVGMGFYAMHGSAVAEAQPTTPQEDPEPARLRVEVVNPEKGKMDRVSSQPGTIQAYESVELYAVVAGYLVKQTVDIGDRVSANAVLAKVDVPELEKQVQRHEAVLEQANARVAQMKARAESARAELDAARAAVPRAEALLKSKSAELRYRQQQLQRMRELAESKSIEDRLVDESISHRDAVREGELAAQEGVTSAKATVVAMAAKIQAADADVDEAKAEVKVAQAELEKARVMVQFATIKAPFDGVVTQRNFFPGDYVRAAHEGGARMPLLVVQRMDKMRVVVQIPDRDVPYCDPGDEASVEIDALPGKALSGKVARIGHSEDPETRLMRVEIDLPNPSGKICHGMYGRVTLLLEKSALLALPSACLLGGATEGKASVFVIRDGRAHRVTVRTNGDNGLQVGIVSGLKPEDQVIVHPPSELTNGAIVETNPRITVTDKDPP